MLPKWRRYEFSLSPEGGCQVIVITFGTFTAPNIIALGQWVCRQPAATTQIWLFHGSRIFVAEPSAPLVVLYDVGDTDVQITELIISN